MPPFVPLDSLEVSPRLTDLPEMVAPLEDLWVGELRDSFLYRRRDGIPHLAIDIFRRKGSPLLAVVDGWIERMRENPLGGTSVYLVDRTERFRFYYAHLDRYADGLTEAQPVTLGAVIGYVGNTGNARQTSPHLHFEVFRPDVWECDESGMRRIPGKILNPYPLLREIALRRQGRRRLPGR
jgi:murein DD-endopeptidase MepM/ murein hydrolase activator NlpD